MESNPLHPADSLAGLTRAVAAYAAPRAGGPDLATGLGGLLAIASRRPTPLEPKLYDPSFCLILQGAKEVRIGRRELTLAAGDAVVISHHVPVLARITEAAERTPFLALALELDLGLLHELAEQVADSESAPPRPRCLERGPADAVLLEAVARLFALVERTRDARVLAPLVVREIHYRLLTSPHGGGLRQLLRDRSHASQIARSVAALRRDFTRTLTVAELARVAGMSESSFHEHFKDLTETSPLQYQKQLRLLEARRLLTGGGRNVTETALDVGYRSPSQFSREYARYFGHAPKHDLRSSRRA